MNFVKNLKIRTRFNLFISLILSVLYFIVGVLVYANQKNNIEDNINNILYNEAEQLVEYSLLEFEKKQKDLKNSIRIFNYLISQTGYIVATKDTFELDVVNSETGDILTVLANNWLIGTNELYTNNEITEKVSILTGYDAAIFQKTQFGYINFASHIKSGKKASFEDVIIPNTSPIIAAIENGESYNGKIKIFNTWYQASFQPIYVDGKINGMIYCGINENQMDDLFNIISEQKYAVNAYPFIVNIDAKVLMHPALKGNSIENTQLFRKLKDNRYKNKVLKIKYLWPENIDGEEKSMYFKFINEINQYVGITYYDEEIKKTHNKAAIIIFITVLLLCIISLFLINYFTNKTVNRINAFSLDLNNVAKGNIPKPFKILYNDEIENLYKILNKLLLLLNKRLNIIEKLANNKLEESIDIVDAQDKIGSNIIKLQQNIIKTKKQEDKQKEEQEINTWMNEGISKFIEILRFHNQSREELSYNILSNLINYLGANQGGLFLLNDDNPNDLYFEQTACYAYDTKKISEIKIPVTKGLLGRCYQEKKTIYLTELPENYIKISSGLGDAPPNNLVIVPLLFNEEINGIIEIATFVPMKQYKVQFIERIGESIASTISGLKITEKTESLLKKSQDQTKLMNIQEKELKNNLKELKRLKKETEDKELEVRGLFNALNANSLVIEYDITGAVVQVNKKFLETLRISEKDIIGKYHHDFGSFKPDNKDYNQFWNDLKQGKTRSIIESIHVKDKVVWLSETFTPVRNEKGDFVKIINIATNITETKLLEKQLRYQEREINQQEKKINKKQIEIDEKINEFQKKEEEHENVLNAIEKSFIKIELNNKFYIQSVNKLFFKEFNFTKEDIINRDFFEIITENQHKELKDKLNLLIEGKNVKGEISINDNNNKKRKYNYIAHPVLSNQAKLISILIFIF